MSPSTIILAGTTILSVIVMTGTALGFGSIVSGTAGWLVAGVYGCCLTYLSTKEDFDG